MTYPLTPLAAGVDLMDNRRHRPHEPYPRQLAWRVVLLKRALGPTCELMRHYPTEQAATIAADAINRRLGWCAVVDTLYECGCWSFARFEGDPI